MGPPRWIRMLKDAAWTAYWNGETEKFRRLNAEWEAAMDEWIEGLKA